MDYKAVGDKILAAVGGKENLLSAAHCATRLRLVIADNQKVDKEALENTEGVKGVFEASGQLQIIIGTGAVNKVFEEFTASSGVTAASKEEVKQAAAAQAPWYQQAIKTLGDIFVPIIPAIVASGLLMGLLEGFANLYPSITQSGTYTIIHLFSNAAFVFLPILIATSAAKVFGGNIYLGAVIGMIMIHPDLMNAWSVAGAASVPTTNAWFGLYSINLVGYQGHVIPVVIAVWFMSLLERKLHKSVPEMLDLFVTPLVTVLVTGYLTLTIFGPVFSWLENGILGAVQWLVTLPFGIGAALCGALYAPTVVAGVHHMYNALEAGMLSATGYNIWMPIATAANVAQGAAALAFGIKTKNRKQKAIALPSSLSAFLGITEPAIFGVNLRFLRPFMAGCIGGAAGALVAGWLEVSATAYGITGLFGILITSHNLLPYLLIMAVSFGVAFLLTLVLYRDKEDKPQKAKPAMAENSSSPQSFKPTLRPTPVATVNKVCVVATPVAGKVLPLSEVPDPSFAQGILGPGAAVLPIDGKVVAPADAKVTSLMKTHHAIGLTLNNGVELLIHIGINTVELNGEGFTPLVAKGDMVTAGQPLITFDTAFIKQKGYSVITPVIVLNPENFLSVSVQGQDAVRIMDTLLTLRKENS